MRRIVLLACCWLLSASVVVAQEVTFEKHVLMDTFVSEGIAVADLNRDDAPDIVAGAFWFEAPSWIPHPLYEPPTYDPSTEYSRAFLNFTLDVNLDGWTDVIQIGTPGSPAFWYENPRGGDTPWTEHRFFDAAGNESPHLVDVDGDGRKDLLMAHAEDRDMLWLQAPLTPDDTTWTPHYIARGEAEAPGTHRYSHGLGFSDVNGDNRADVIVKEGWYEAPPDPHTPDWTFHEAPLGEDAAHMYTLDLDDDGDLDVMSSSSHNYGIWWHEQIAPDTWQTHLIHDAFSQTHALALADLDDNGLPDLITGKRYFAHNGNDPGGHDPSVLYWFALDRKADGHPTWTPHLIDDASGIGLQILVEHVTGDDRADILVSNKNGVFVFERR